MDTDARQRALEDIQENIARFGYHLYVVTDDQLPRFAYTIGLSPKLGYELVFAGGILFLHDEVGKIIRGVAERLTASMHSETGPCRVDSFGRFSLRRCDPTWTTLLMLGASDFYQRPDIPALQIVPDEDHITLDVPDMESPWSSQLAPVWKYLNDLWPFSVPRSSHVVTDLAALRGAPVTEACRWEEDYWELFAGAGPDVPDEDRRIVGLGTLLAADPSLAPVLDLKVGTGIWRGSGSQWHAWARTENAHQPPV